LQVSLVHNSLHKNAQELHSQTEPDRAERSMQVQR
jgi:hypothetical protein